MRKSVMIAGLVVLALALGSPAFAVCVAPRSFASVGSTVDTAYVYRADIAAAWGGVFPAVTEGPTTSVDNDVKGWFWALGAGNPTAALGIDNGTQTAYGNWLFYGGTNVGTGNYYPHYIAGGWSGDLAIDGCIDTTGTNPAGPDASQCTMILMNDDDGAGNSYFALASAGADGLGNYDFSTTGQIILQPVPKPKITGSTRVSSSQVDITVALSSVPAGPGGGLYLGCGSGPASFKVYRRSVPRDAPAPTSRDLAAGQGWQAAGSAPTNGSAPISVTCSGDEDIYLATSLVFDSGFELALGSANGSAVQCGPTLVDPVKPILPPRRGKPTNTVGPRDDRGSRR